MHGHAVSGLPQTGRARDQSTVLAVLLSCKVCEPARIRCRYLPILDKLWGSKVGKGAFSNRQLPHVMNVAGET